jgi:thioredoxin reductase (NADPH)
VADCHCDVVIIGAGPAGLTAAIYASRAALDVLVVEGEPTSNTDLPGGQLMLTTEVENYPGFPEGVMGPDLITNLRTQAERFGTRVMPGKVDQFRGDTCPFGLSLTTGETVVARSVIVATGSTSRRLNLENEARLVGHGVSTCATCDGFFFRGLDVAIVGGGDSAVEEAIFLAKFARSVTMIHRRGELRASKIMQQRAFAHDKISFEWNAEVAEIRGEDKLDSLLIRDVNTLHTREITVDGLFLAIGHDPATGVFQDHLDLDEHGYVRTEPGRTHTSVEGVFACGDVQDPIYRQAITSAGTGCMAAIDAERWLEHHSDAAPTKSLEVPPRPAVVTSPQ